MKHSKDISHRSTFNVEIPRRVIVKFRENAIKLPYEDNADKKFEREWKARWEKLGESFPGISLKRLYVSVAPGKIEELKRRAAKLDPSYEPMDFLTFFAIDVPPGIDPDLLAEALTGWEIVEYAYAESAVAKPPAQPTGANPELTNQRYLEAPQVGMLAAQHIGGINARFAWNEEQPTSTVIGAAGGVTYIVIERGWNLNHEDLSDAHINLVSGLNLDERSHGTRVLGILAAQDNGMGGVGIAHQSTGRVVSGWTAANTPINWSNAIIAAINALTFGDVLLLEAQIQPPNRPLLPIELESANFAAIRLATALGIIVVEAAGNGSTLLDNQLDNNGRQILNRSHIDFKDSGAILVAAADPVGNRANRRISSNYGARVDCFAWGSQVTTTDTDVNGNANLYTNAFTGTSAASAIVAGAAIVLQSIAENPQRLGHRLSAFQMRNILRNPITGTLSANSTFVSTNADGIGVMPNLQRIIQNTLNILPDVVVRDNLADNGDPHLGLASTSPDIIIRSANTVLDPQASFGGSATIWNAYLSSPISTGTDSYDIFVRVFNRGRVSAADVHATVYWAEPATNLNRPDLWTRVNTSASANVPANIASITVLPRITWPRNQIPGAGSYSFIVTVGCPDDPDPIPDPRALIDPVNPNALSSDHFLDLLRWNNNISRRNFHVVTLPSSAGSNPPGLALLPFNLLPANLSLDFLAPGGYDVDRLMQLEVVAHLPEGAQLWLEGPANFVNAMVKGHYEQVREEKMRLPLSPYGINRFQEIVFPANSLNPLQLHVSIPEEHRRGTYEMYVRHLYNGEEVGRITWQLIPEIRRDDSSPGDSSGRYFAGISPLTCLLYVLLILELLIIIYLLLSRLG